MTPQQRQKLAEILMSGEEVSPEWSRILFPPERREYELVYHSKERSEDIVLDTLKKFVDTMDKRVTGLAFKVPSN